MSAKAFVIAIEDYSLTNAFARTLTGVCAGAERFLKCVTDDLDVARSDCFVCSSREFSGTQKFPDSKSGIKNAVRNILDSGKDQTERLYVYIAGHGVSVETRGQQADYLLTSDFANTRDSGDCSISTIELARLFGREMGPGNHLWFIDTCQTSIPAFAAAGLGINPVDSYCGRASYFILNSASPGQVAANDSCFIDAIVSGLAGNSRLIESVDQPGVYRVTFQSIASAVSETLKEHGRQTYVRTQGGRNDCTIRALTRATPTAAILTAEGMKSPPVKLLTDFDDLVFLGETIGQLPDQIEAAFQFRQFQPWKSIELFSVNDLSKAFRRGTDVRELESERRSMEEYFIANARTLAHRMRLFRYDYDRRYMSLWQSNDGCRRAHVSAGVLGEDIRNADATDYVDFPNARIEKIDSFYHDVDRVRESDTCMCIFSSERPQADV